MPKIYVHLSWSEYPELKDRVYFVRQSAPFDWMRIQVYQSEAVGFKVVDRCYLPPTEDKPERCETHMQHRDGRTRVFSYPATEERIEAERRRNGGKIHQHIIDGFDR